MSNRNTNRRADGELRQSQLLTTFGPGSMVDLPDHSVLIGGLDHWDFSERQPIYEDRLIARLHDLLKTDDLKLFAPPIDSDDPKARRSGITAFLFPTWFLAQVEETFKASNGRIYRTRPLVKHTSLVKGKYPYRNGKNVSVVPVRFVQACRRGHISDVDWYAYVRETYDHDNSGPLWLDEGGAGNDFAEIYIRDEKRNNHRRPLSLASLPNSKVLGTCSGRMPWLGDRTWENCDEDNRLLTRSASNAYFSQTLSVIAIPDSDGDLMKGVDEVYEDFLQYCEDLEDVSRERRKEKVKNALEGFGNEAVWEDILRRKGKVTKEVKSIKQVEIETLLSQPGTIGEDVPEGDFYARSRSLHGLPESFGGRLDRAVLVHRLREVIAQVGFTRFEPSMPDIDGELSMNVERAPLARETSWLPAIENRGEGIFLSFSDDAIRSWMSRPAVKTRGRQLVAGFESWVGRKDLAQVPSFPGLAYIMLHSLAHLLITAVSLECGYSASAIRERIYAGEYGYGILLYTGASGSEGTLGGLVDIGRNIESHLRRALELGRLCSNDPVCSQHDPSNPHEERFLHGAACHGCLLIAETSCERGNEYLDRALVVPTVTAIDTAFFDEDII